MVHALGVARDLGADDAVRIRLRCAVDTSDALGCPELNFQREDEGLPIQIMADMVDAPVRLWMKAAGATAADAQKSQISRAPRR